MLKLVVNNRKPFDKINKKLEDAQKEEEMDLLDELIISFSQDDTDLSEGLYPIQPGIDSLHDNAGWYVSDDATYGCWIVNDYKRKFFLSHQVNRNHSIFPSYKLKVSKRLAVHICWHTNEEGYSQYRILIGGIIVDIPKGLNLL